MQAMMSTKRRLAGAVGLAVVAIAFAWLAVPVAVAKTQPRRARPGAPQLTLHLRFDRLARAYRSLFSDGRHVMLVGAAPEVPTVLVDDRTGTRAEFPEACTPLGIGGGLVLSSCGLEWEVSALSGADAQVVNAPAVGDLPVAVGRDWVEWDQPCDDVHLYCQVYVFENIQTGALLPDPTNAATLPDLNAAGLARLVCAPLVVPTSDFLLSPTSWLVFDGSFAIATRSAAGSGTHLERCGTSLHRQIDENATPVAANSKAVVWVGSGHWLRGLFLPSLRRFRIKFPAESPGVGTGDEGNLVLGPRTLYLLDVNHRVWTAPAPFIPGPAR